MLSDPPLALDRLSVTMPSRRILAISSFRCATIASAPDALASACWRAVRSVTSAAFSASISSGRGSGIVTTAIVA